MRHPLAATLWHKHACMGGAAMRQGYASGDPAKRINPLHLAGMLSMLGLVGTTIKVAVDLLRSK